MNIVYLDLHECAPSHQKKEKRGLCHRASLLHDSLGMYRAQLQLHSQTDNTRQYMHRILTDQWVHPVPRQLKTSRLYSLETSMTDGLKTMITALIQEKQYLCVLYTSDGSGLQWLG